MLAEADTIQKAKELKSLALTAAEWAKRKNMGEEAIQHCRSYALEAERKMGEMLKETERAKGIQGQAGPGKGKRGNMALPRLSGSPPTLTELGLTKRESSEAQLLAELPAEDFEKLKRGEKTKIEAKRERKSRIRQAKRSQNAAVIAANTVEDFNWDNYRQRFSCIVIDPPWDWGDEGDQDQLGRAKPDYATMSIDKIASLPIGECADRDGCHLYLWITNRSLPKGFDLIKNWGFRYVTCLTWCKPSFGMGNYFRGQTEHVLFGVMGSLPLSRKDAGTWFEAPRGKGHSAKPKEFYDLAERCSPEPRADIFGRMKRNGWVVIGGEVLD